MAQHQAAAMAAAFFRFLRQLKKIERREPAPHFLSSACHKLALCNSSGSLAILTAIRRASSRD
jgi:hypothetical protein